MSATSPTPGWDKFLGFGGWPGLAGAFATIFWGFLHTTRWGSVLAAGMASLSILLYTFHLERLQVRLWRPLAGVSALTSFAALVWLVLAVPSGNPGPQSPVSQRFSTHVGFPKYSYANLVPEIEQMNLGLKIIGHLDRLMTTEKVDRLSRLTLGLYREMDRDPDFRELGSAMAGSYAEVLGLDYPEGHYYLYLPKNAPARPLPAVVFLHGSAGNFKVYTWLWSHLANELGCVVIAPSFGFGNWDQPGGVETVMRALKDAQQVVKLAPKRIHLAGLSNGGLGVCGVLEIHPDTFAGAILISPVMVDRVTSNSLLLSLLNKRPFLILTGGQDERVHDSYVRTHADRLRQGGVDVTFIGYPEEDHFLIFSQREKVFREIASWLKAHPGG